MGSFACFPQGTVQNTSVLPIVKISLKKGELFCLPYFYDHPRRNY